MIILPTDELDWWFNKQQKTPDEIAALYPDELTTADVLAQLKSTGVCPELTKEEFVRLHHREYFTLEQIATAYLMTVDELNKQRKAWKLKALEYRIPVIPRELLENLYVEKKLPLSEVAKLVDHGVGFVKKCLRYHGMKIRHDTSLEIDEQELLWRREEGGTIAWLAEHFGCTEGTISNRLKSIQKHA